MDMLVLILALSTVMWYLIERLKTELWGELKCSRWITILVAAVAGFALTFAYDLDIIAAAGLVQVPSIAGKVITGFTFMAGSSAVAEILNAIRGNKNEINK